MTESLHTKYRPVEWNHVLGQDHVVASMRSLVESKSQHAFLLCGPRGTGKTSLARIAADKLEAGERIEIDAATNTGIDDMRKITSKLSYVPLGGGTTCIIVDECHRLSANAWDSLLRSVEEPPDWVYWFFCTTDPARIPATIVSRCAKYVLKPLPWGTLLEQLIQPIAQDEGFPVGGADNVLALCARSADGSPRQALVNLAACANITDIDAAGAVLQQLVDDGDNAVVIRVARTLMQAVLWKQLAPMVAELADESAEGVRRELLAYMTKVALDEKQSDKAKSRALAVMDYLSMQFNYSDGFPALVLALGRASLPA